MPKLTYPHVMSTLALFLALSSGAWAVGLGRNSIADEQLAPEAVGSSELKRDAAKGRDVAESTLGTVPSAANADSAAYAQTADIAFSADTAYTADTAYSADTASSADTANTVAPDGVDAAALQDGAVGASEVGDIKVRVNDGTVGPTSSAFVQVACRPEEKLLSGGVFVDNATTEPEAQVVRSSPSPVGTGWQGGVYNGNTTESLNYAVRALCLAG